MRNRAAYRAHIVGKRVHITYMRDEQRGVHVAAVRIGGVEVACATAHSVGAAVRVAVWRCRRGMAWRRQASCQGVL